jgi:hypothetical protein
VPPSSGVANRATSAPSRLKFEGAPEPRPPENGLKGGEPLSDLFDEFKQHFCHRPGENFFAYVQDLPEFVRALHSESNATAMAFVNLLVDSLRQGVDYWAVSRVQGFRNGGAPPQATLDLLGAFAIASGKPVRLYNDATRRANFCTTILPQRHEPQNMQQG